MSKKVNGFLNIIFLFLSFSLLAQIDANKELIKIDKLSAINLNTALKYTDSILNFDLSNKDTIQFKYCKLVFRSHDYNKALQLYKKLEKKHIIKKRYDYLLASYLGIAQTNTFLKNQDNAIKYAHKALKLAKKTNDLTHQSEALNIFAYIYSTVKDYKKAIYYLSEYINLQKDKKNIELASGYYNLSICHLKLKQLDSANFFLTKSLPIFIKLNMKERLSMIYDNMGEIDKELKKYPNAITNYKKAIRIDEELKTSFLSPYLNLAETYHILSKYNKAYKYYLKALTIANKTKNTEKQELIYHKLLGISLNRNNTKKAKYYLNKRDSLDVINLNLKTKDKAKLIETQFEQRIEQDKLKQKLEISKKNKIILGIIIALLSFLGLFLYQKNKNSKLILNQEKLVLEQKVLRAQMNPHFIFNALTSIQKNLLEDDLLTSSRSLARFAKLIRQNFEFINKNSITLEEDLDALKNYIETQKVRFKKKFDYQIELHEDIETSSIKIPPMLLQPFIENAIEHGLKEKKEKGTLSIKINNKPNLITFTIIDNGVGFKSIKTNTDRDHAIDIFLKRLKLRGLGEEKSFSIKSLKNGIGTRVNFSLKIKNQ